MTLSKLLDDPYWAELIDLTRALLGNRPIYISKEMSRSNRESKEYELYSILTQHLIDGSLMEVGKTVYIQSEDLSGQKESETQVSRRRFWTSDMVVKFLEKEMPLIKLGFLNRINDDVTELCSFFQHYKVKDKAALEEIKAWIQSLKKETNLQLLYSIHKNLLNFTGEDMRKTYFDYKKMEQNVPLSDAQMIRPLKFSMPEIKTGR